MNKPIRTMSIACMVLFMALLVNATYLQYLQADELNSRNDNKRVRDAEFSRERGAILVNDKSIAESVAADQSGAQAALDDQAVQHDQCHHSGQAELLTCLLYTSPSPRDGLLSRMPSSA